MEVSGFTQINLSEGTFRDVVERVVENNGLKRGVIALGEMSKDKFVRVFANEPIRSETELAETNKGSMATGGGTTGRTPAGNTKANKIFEIVRLLEEKKD